MKQNNISDLDFIFKKLIEACSHDDAYSVHEICSFFKVSYAYIKDIAATSEKYSHLLEMCYTMCLNNAKMAGLMSRIPNEEAFKYMDKPGERLDYS